MALTKSQSCCECQRASQEVESEYTLIRTGWRNLVVTDDDGRREAQWYCPACWAKRKAQNTGT